MNFLKRLFSSESSLEQHFSELRLPVKRNEIRSLSLLCDHDNFKQITAVYEALLPDSTSWAVQHLNPLLDLPEVKEWLGRISTWKALASQMRGEIICNIKGVIPPSEATLFPRIAFGFSLDERLGMVTARRNTWIFLRMGAFRNANIGQSIQSPDSCIDITSLQRILERTGWRCLSFP